MYRYITGWVDPTASVDLVVTGEISVLAENPMSSTEVM
jgi:hypothetical protein